MIAVAKNSIAWFINAAAGTRLGLFITAAARTSADIRLFTTAFVRIRHLLTDFVRIKIRLFESATQGTRTRRQLYRFTTVVA